MGAILPCFPPFINLKGLQPMADDLAARQATCALVEHDLFEFAEKANEHRATIKRLEPEISSAATDIGRLQSQLNSIVDLMPRLSPRPSRRSATVDTAIAVGNEVRRAQIRAEIDLHTARLRRLSRELGAARKGLENAESNRRQTVRNYERHRCADFRR